MSKEYVTTIPYVRKCFYDTYANLPVAGIKIGDLGFATDRLVLYRWSGAAWEYLTFHFSSGTAANIPVAADLPNGSCYYTTDTKLLMQVQAGAWVDITPPAASYGRLTVLGFQLFPASGTFSTTPENLNDNSPASNCLSNAVDQYSEVIFNTLLHITQFRQYGNVSNNGDGSWKIQYQNAAGAWIDWVTGIVTRATADWSNWDSTGGDVVAMGIRLVTTALDTAGNQNRIAELEVIY